MAHSDQPFESNTLEEQLAHLTPRMGEQATSANEQVVSHLRALYQDEAAEAQQMLHRVAVRLEARQHTMQAPVSSGHHSLNGAISAMQSTGARVGNLVRARSLLSEIAAVAVVLLLIGSAVVVFEGHPRQPQGKPGAVASVTPGSTGAAPTTTTPNTVERHVFSLESGAQPALSINDDVGRVQVHVGPQAQVTAVITKLNIAHPELYPVSYTQQGSQLGISVHFPSAPPPEGGNGESPRVDIDVTLPKTSDLSIQVQVGSISVQGLQGRMQLHSDTGTIEASEMALTGDSSFVTNTGEVVFSGQIAAQAQATFQTQTGNITVTLPAQASFTVTAKSDLGEITSAFAGIDVQRDGLGAAASGTVGTGPAAHLMLTTNVGTITLKSQ